MLPAPPREARIGSASTRPGAQSRSGPFPVLVSSCASALLFGLTLCVLLYGARAWADPPAAGATRQAFPAAASAAATIDTAALIRRLDSHTQSMTAQLNQGLRADTRRTARSALDAAVASLALAQDRMWAHRVRAAADATARLAAAPASEGHETMPVIVIRPPAPERHVVGDEALASASSGPASESIAVNASIRE